MEPCIATKYACVETSTNTWNVSVHSPSLCRLDRPVLMTEWDCSKNIETTISGQLATNVKASFEPGTAHGLGQFMVTILLAIGVILLYCGFFLGAYIYRK